MQVDPSLYFVCPELIVLQMAARLTIPQLVQLIMELCGYYTLAPIRRLRDIQYLGIQVVPVTSFDLGDIRRMDQVAYALAANFLTNDHEAFEQWAARLEELPYLGLRANLLREIGNAI